MRVRNTLFASGLILLGLSLSGQGMGLPTLTTVTVDGNFDDWRDVLLNPLQVSHDGNGYGFGDPPACLDYTTDRDCGGASHMGGTGRDLLTFAWTYDDDHVSVYIERWGSTANTINFYFLMDLDGDGAAGTSDRVFETKWSGSNGSTTSTLYAYQPADGVNPDSLTDGEGYVDGYDMPGFLGAAITDFGTKNGGDVSNGPMDGMRFEEQIPWSDLGIATGTPILWHVSSNNTGDIHLPSDNIGGPGGKLGSFAFGSIAITESWTLSVGSPGIAWLPHSLENSGNISDHFDLIGSTVLGSSLSYYTDNFGGGADGDPSGETLLATDANGDGDFSDAGDVLSSDGNGNGLLDVFVSANGTTDMVLVAEVAAGLDGQIENIDLRVEWAMMPLFYYDETSDQLIIGALSIYPDHQAAAMAGLTVPFAHRITNNANEADTAELQLTSSQGWPLRLYADPNLDDSPDALLAEDIDGDGNWDIVAPGADNNGDANPDTGELAAFGGTTGIVIEVMVPGGTALDTVDLTTARISSATYPSRTGTARNRTTVKPRVTIEPDYLYPSTHLTGAANSSVYFPYLLTNAWLATDSFALATVSSQPWTVQIWSDPNGDGNPTDGTLISNSSAVAGLGGTFPLVLEVQIPADTANGTTNILTLTAQNAEASDSAQGDLEVRLLQSFRDELYLFQASYFSTCQRVFTEMGGMATNETGRYTLRYYSDNKALLEETQDIASDVLGQAQAQRLFDTGDPLDNPWVLELTDAGAPMDEIAIWHERAGAIDPPVIAPQPAVVGGRLQVSMMATNQNLRAPFSETRLLTRILTPTGGSNQVLMADGNFVPYDGSQVTQAATFGKLAPGDFFSHGFTVAAVNYPAAELGDYRIEVSWQTILSDPITKAILCQVEIASAATTVSVVDCANDADCDDGEDCSSDTCTGGACVHATLADTTPCAGGDGNSCTSTCLAGACVGGPVNCDDGLICSADFCDPADGSCLNPLFADGTGCDGGDGNPCNSSCAAGACVAVAVLCDDLIDCTIDSCDPADGACHFAPDNTLCPDNGLFCDGTEFCHGLAGCIPSGDPCLGAGQVCDEASDRCAACTQDPDCDDAVACTVDTCLDGDCVHASESQLCADDNIFCNGSEICDPLAGCVSVGDPCLAAGKLCDENSLSCQDCLIDAQCHDGVACTDDTCVDGSCVSTTNDANCPDDCLYCTGVESCDPLRGCVSTGNPCLGFGQVCDEAGKICVDCLADDECNDGIACTVDACVSQLCVSTADDQRCADDGLFCNGTEFCAQDLGCLSTGDPCAPGLLCDETADLCGDCLADDDCNDGIGCTVDTCAGGTCLFVPSNALCADDGLYCSGTEFCDVMFDCVASGDPCAFEGLICREDTDRCQVCATAADCDDGIGCTTDSCSLGQCLHTPDSSLCPDDSLFCTGDEYCALGAGCVSDGDPCLGSGRLCAESVDQCVACQADGDCNDGVACTRDDCVGGFCIAVPLDTDCATDGVFCNGEEICDPVLGCQSEGDPCPATGKVCNEAGAICADCAIDNDCDDGVTCTADSCPAGSCLHQPIDGNCVDYGVYCNGAEICDLLLGCGSTGDPCVAVGLICNEGGQSCDPCTVDGECDDGIDCTVDSCNTGTCLHSADDAICADGVFCNGTESCDPQNGCLSAGDPCPAAGLLCAEASTTCVECLVDGDCDDSISCTIDHCVDRVCVIAAHDASCPDDGLFCTGVNLCQTETGCKTSGDPCAAAGLLCDEAASACMFCIDDQDCDDQIACTLDSCPDGFCAFAPDDSQCADDGSFCNGNEACDPSLGCISTGDPCLGTGKVCSELGPACVDCTLDPDCSDGIDCTDDLCLGGTCTSSVNHGLCPDDGLFCSGSELCDPSLGCRSAGDPCTGSFCNEAGDFCGECELDANCDDAVACTDNHCLAGTCSFLPVHAACANDGLFCNGSEYCDRLAGCVASGNPCPDGSLCDESRDACGACLGDADCDDTIACTLDTCIDSICRRTADHGQCLDDLQFCNGTELCDLQVGCISGGDPCAPVGLVCDDLTDTCGVCGQDSDCDDGIACTVDTCSAGECIISADDSLCADDGVFCNGAELCSLQAGCLSAGDPCAGSFCAEADDACTECGDDANCDDGVACTEDSCQQGICVFTALDNLCPDNGQFCLGQPRCDLAAGCLASGDPCAALGLVCNEDHERCDLCQADADCDDRIDCTLDRCDLLLGTCRFAPDDTACADDGSFCNGVEYCDSGAGCVPAGDPCAPHGSLCNETDQRCDACTLDTDCDDGINCTEDLCRLGHCAHRPDDSQCPDDGSFCNGPERCDLQGGCLGTGNPCAATEICDEALDSCAVCADDSDCDDGIGCTVDTCASGSCVFSADHTQCLNDGLFCNGAELCDPAAGCLPAGDPCLGSGLVCHEQSDRCDRCSDDGQCNDQIACTTDSCVSGRCTHNADDSLCPDDGLFCNGIEFCAADGGCQSAGDPCLGAGQRCDEPTARCVDCRFHQDCSDAASCTEDYCDIAGGVCAAVAFDARCDDGQFCNGIETCDPATDCSAGADPCPDQVCSAATDSCVDCLVDNDCDDQLSCTLDHCVAGPQNCAHTPDDSLCDDQDDCTADSCSASAGCQHSYLDLDGDGTCDADDPCPDDPDNACIACTDSDGDGICDPFDLCPQDANDKCPACADDDLDGICNAQDECPDDPNDSCRPCADADQDQLCDDVDPCPADADNSCGSCTNQVDVDGDGRPTCVDPCPADPYDSCVPCADADGDDICDPFDPCPYDPTNTCPACADDDADGACNLEDPCPDDPLDLCPSCPDLDRDGLCDGQDPCPNDPSNTCAGCRDPRDPDGDGLSNCIDPCPTDHRNDSLHCPDADQDGNCDADDPCPRDDQDQCFSWDQAQIKGGGCACASPGGSHSGLPLLLLLALLGTMLARFKP